MIHRARDETRLDETRSRNNMASIDHHHGRILRQWAVCRVSVLPLESTEIDKAMIIGGLVEAGDVLALNQRVHHLLSPSAG